MQKPEDFIQVLVEVLLQDIHSVELQKKNNSIISEKQCIENDSFTEIRHNTPQTSKIVN